MNALVAASYSLASKRRNPSFTALAASAYDDDSCAAIGETPYHLGEDIHTTWNRHFDVDPLGRHFLKKLQWDFDAEGRQRDKPRGCQPIAPTPVTIGRALGAIARRVQVPRDATF